MNVTNNNYLTPGPATLSNPFPGGSSAAQRCRRSATTFLRQDRLVPEPEGEEPLFAALELRLPAHFRSEHDAGSRLHRQPLGAPARQLRSSTAFRAST